MEGPAQCSRVGASKIDPESGSFFIRRVSNSSIEFDLTDACSTLSGGALWEFLKVNLKAGPASGRQ
jgi:hypothetical protein